MEQMRNNKKKSVRKFVRKSLPIFFTLGVILLFLRFFILLPSEINGRSMAPTLLDDDKIIVNTLGDLQRFDIVVFKDEGQKPVVKRIIGIPGDTLYYHNDQLYINGQEVPEPYLEKVREQEEISGILTSNFTLDQASGHAVIPEKEYFVLGDNRRYSYDSRHYGNISESSIIGDVELIYYPIKRFSFLR